MKRSARNVIPGNGVVPTAAITNEAMEEPGLAPGKTASAVVKASGMMVGVE
ncbi:TOBE domain-containing protein [Humitalea sp. 24SJ18S-53]|uniref:TOBE domain-containing protein n=1 Tax=Humitalea sp. 24SJ18S-53 TaxID=3422307 RepID=UPI003D6642BB